MNDANPQYAQVPTVSTMGQGTKVYILWFWIWCNHKLLHVYIFFPHLCTDIHDSAEQLKGGWIVFAETNLN